MQQTKKCVRVDKKGEKERKREEGENRGGNGERERERETKNGDFPGIPTVEARRSEKKSRSTHRRLHVVTKILEFHQTPLGREFSYLEYF